MAKSVYLQAPNFSTHVTPKGTLRVKDEDWSIVVNTKESSGEERGLAEICVSFPDGSKWVGSIQDLRAIQQYAVNTMSFLEKMDHAGVDEQIELTELLSHFKV